MNASPSDFGVNYNFIIEFREHIPARVECTCSLSLTIVAHQHTGIFLIRMLLIRIHGHSTRQETISTLQASFKE